MCLSPEAGCFLGEGEKRADVERQSSMIWTLQDDSVANHGSSPVGA
jgi:hypothetical protein